MRIFLKRTAAITEHDPDPKYQLDTTENLNIALNDFDFDRRSWYFYVNL